MKQRITSAFAAMSTRERVSLGVAAVFLGAALLWWLGVAPALRSLQNARNQAPVLNTQLQAMRGQAHEAAALKGQKQLSREESRRAFEAAMPTLGVGANMSVQGDRMVVNLKNSPADSVAAWLAQVRANARLVPSELHLKASNGQNPSLIWEGNVIFNLASSP